MDNSNIINAVFGSGICVLTTSVFSASYGMKLRFSGIDLPSTFEVDFSNYDVPCKDSVTAIGQNGEVQIPDQLWDSGLNIYAFVYLHPTDDSGVTVYTVTIPVLGRPNRTEEEPTPHEQSVIEQAISALNNAVEQTAADVASADASAQAAAQSEANASVSERAAAASASAALASQNAAESAAQSATESASGASESAQNAANSASQAAESATSAQASAEQAESSVQSIADDVERAERAAATATGKATEAASSAATASTKATQAEQSATAAAQSASSASTAAQNAASLASSAESSATDAEQAKTDAQDARTAAEQAASSVSGLSAQIAQNTADIADLVQNKAGALIDTVSGSIASFVPDATIPTVKGLSVEVEPVQDLHGYDNPWPAGGGKNKIALQDGIDFTLKGVRYYTDAGNLYLDGTSTGETSSTDATFKEYFSFTLQPGTYYFSRMSYPNAAYLRSNSGALVTNNGVFTIEEPTEVWVSFYIYNKVFNNEQCPIIIVTGSSAAAEYSPFSNICPISGWDGVEVTRTGKNLANPKLYHGGFYNPTIGSTWNLTESSVQLTDIGNGQFSVTLGSWAFRVFVFDLADGQSYRFKCVFAGTDVATTYGYLDGNYTVLSKFNETGATVNKSVTFTGTSERKRAYVGFAPRSSEQTLTLTELQLELGSTATDYEPYQGNTYTIQLGQTVYGGTLDVTTGVLTVDRAMVDLGTLTWNASSRETTYKIFSTNGIASLIKDSANNWTIPTNFMCSQYKTVTFNEAYAGNTNGVISYAKGNHSVNLVDSNFADYSVTEVATALSGVQLVYELATPITVDLTPIEVAVLTGQTNNIWADSGDVSVEYAADLKTYINNKIAAAVAALS